MMQDTGYTIQDKEHTPQKGGIMHHASCIVHREKGGFTLIELVITMLLIGIVAFIVADAMSTGFKAYFVTDNRKEALDQARIAMERMTREIRNVRSLGRDNDGDGNIDADITTANASELCFTDTNNTAIRFRLSGTNILRSEGTSCPPATENTLAEKVTTLTFSYTYASGSLATAVRRVQITITSTISSESVTLSSEVYLRNLQ
ncbi:MAG: prepilin-type N-terminal cleavage/methylation domain-containing protein [Nitrospirae bacterium]|nr:prepilin-type N-terminal cleavage/methylation domain-containing protein [Nitrospirota bacterium]